jgi:hypothetical protein
MGTKLFLVSYGNFGQWEPNCSGTKETRKSWAPIGQNSYKKLEKVGLPLAKLFQRRRLECEKLMTDDDSDSNN